LVIFPLRQREIIFNADKTKPVHEQEWVLAQEIKKVSLDHTKMIVAGGYTIHKGGNDLCPSLYYYSGVRGWSIQEGEWNESVVNMYKNRGANLLAVLNYKREEGLNQFIESMMHKYQVLFINPDLEIILISLNDKNK
jgi:hypothetical protein